jgi:hypothetical protein
MPARKPQPKPGAPSPVKLVDPGTQSKEWLHKHILKRHPGVRFVTWGDHDANHRLFQNYLDHTHEERD